MRKLFLLYPILNLFDGGAAAPAPVQDGEGAQAEAKAGPGRSRRGKTGGLETVVYGKVNAAGGGGSPLGDGKSGQSPALSGPDAGDQGQGEGGNVPAQGEESARERMARFRDLVDGEYKDLFTQETQRIIDRRFKETKGLQEALEAQRPVLELLGQKYGVEDLNPEKLARAIEADDGMWAKAAEEAGMSVEQYKQFQKLQRENRLFQEQAARQRSQQAAQQQLGAWEEEARQVKAVYPEFDLAAECQNPRFLAMLKARVPVQHAYEVLHLEDIKGGVARSVAQTTEKKVAASVQANGSRPVENGISSQSGITIKSDVSKLTARDRAEIARRAARGEQIIF